MSGMTACGTLFMTDNDRLVTVDPVKSAQYQLSQAISKILDSRDYREGNGIFTAVYGSGNDRQLIYTSGHPIARWIYDNQRDFPANITQHTKQRIFYSQKYGNHEIEISDYFKDLHNFATDIYRPGHFELGDFNILDITDKPVATYVDLAWQKIFNKHNNAGGYSNLQHKKYEISATVKKGLISIDQVASDELNEVMHLQGLLKSKPELFIELFTSGKTLHNFCQNNPDYANKISKYININGYLAKNFPLLRPEKIYQDIYIKIMDKAVAQLTNIFSDECE